MTFYKRILLWICVIFICLPLSFVANAFIVRAIQFEGLQRISASTVRSYLPFHEGQDFGAAQGDAIIKALYKTGFFENVQLSRRGDALIIQVVERPTISLIRISGNKAINSKKLRPVLDKMGITEGQTYDPTKINEIVLGLEQQYQTLGYRAATVNTKVVPGPRNTVTLYINVQEGTVATVRAIHFVGNHAFSQRKLREQFKLTTRGLFTWITHKDRYSAIKLQEDLQSLTDFYLNHGYLRFRILSKEVTLTPDKTRVDIVIHLSEGPAYYIGSYRVVGDTYGFQDQLYQAIRLKKGQLFSRQAIIDNNKILSDFLADRGYAFADVNVSPTIEDQNHVVNLTFVVSPGHRVYVRRINFFGNERTDQRVFRREMRQYEAGTYSLSKIEESKRRLQLLGYLDNDVKYDAQPIEGHPDQVDLDWHLKEIPAGRASVQGGYSDMYGFLYGASISEPNFMGTGKYVSLGFQNSQYSQYYSFGYNNPYYTSYGVSRGFTVYYSRVKPNNKFNFESYLMDGYGLDVNYGFPVSERNSLGLGYGFEHIAISQINPSIAAPSILAFLGIPPSNSTTLQGRNYNQFKVTGGWAYNGLDRAIFPTKGFYNGITAEVGVPILKSSVGYYTATYNAKYYQPLGAGFILNILGTAGWGEGFGDNQLPFFKNFFAGGIGSVPAFSPNSLGPKNRYNGDGSLGGNLELVGGVHLILPTFISPKVRTALIFDAGNVFQVPRFPGDIAVPARASVTDSSAATTPQVIQDYSVAWRNIRPSAGLGVEWWSPVGPIDITVAFPLNKRSGDETQPFQFSFGMSL